jgi:hypothetical protein
VQPRPTASELLTVVAQVLDDQIVPALDGPAQHHARVAASLVAIVERELRLGPAADEREREAIRGLLDDDRDDGDLHALRARLSAALRAGMADDEATSARVWAILLAAARDDLAISKPGHDGWEGT